MANQAQPLPDWALEELSSLLEFPSSDDLVTEGFEMVAVCFDISGYSTWLRDATSRSAAGELIKSFWRVLLDAGLSDRIDGRLPWFRPTGDGALAVWCEEDFTSIQAAASHASRLACYAARGWSLAREQLPVDPKDSLNLRAAVCCGSGIELVQYVELSDSTEIRRNYDLAGVALNNASRLQSLCPSGEVLGDADTCWHVRKDPDFLVLDNWKGRTKALAKALARSKSQHDPRKGTPEGLFTDARLIRLAE